MRTYQFWQIDAFTAERYQGNAAAVVFDADALDGQTMQVIARQMNLSESVFLCSPTEPEADFRARIFTPRSELPFAGHPTIAAAHAWYHGREAPSGSRTELRQECGIGVVPIAIEGSLQAPRFVISMGRAEAHTLPLPAEAAARMVGCAESDLVDWPIESCATGLPWMVVPFARLAPLTRAVPDQSLIESRCREFGVVGLSAYALEAERAHCQVHIRSFAPGEGIPEDPVCGSGNGAVALHIARHPRKGEREFTYVAEQGIEMGYNGEVHVAVSNNRTGEPSVKVGGAAVTVMQGELYV